MNRARAPKCKEEDMPPNNEIEDFLERYSHEGYLIKVVVMALAGEVTRKLSPILSWSNNNYDLKLGEKARGPGVAHSGATCGVLRTICPRNMTSETQIRKILFTPVCQS